MNANFSADPEVNRYFQNLPKYVQESILQCGPAINNVQEIRALAYHLLQDDTTST